jgi:hypothetical protein
VDDSKISHVEKKVVTNIIQKLCTKFGKESPLTIKLGKKYDYLGMIIDYRGDWYVRIDISKYIKNILSEESPEIRVKAITPAATDLFATN